MKKGEIVTIAGPLIVARGIPGARIYDLVKVGTKKLIGEIIEIREDLSSIQVYEDTSLMAPGEPVESTHAPLSVELAPGLIGAIFDGIQRPLDAYAKKAGNFLIPGLEIPILDRKKKWKFDPIVSKGETVVPGDVIGIVQETDLIEHKVMVPHDVSGKISDIKKGSFTIEDTIATITDGKNKSNAICMLKKWPVRFGRPYKNKLPPQEALVTGQRVIDTLFPVPKGGTTCIPGPFGSGKTVVQHQLAKWSDTSIVIFIGCGERGNEMTDVLLEFPKLKDPKSGKPLMQRTILIANTSNMPIAAREASVYTGVTLAEYFRDQGYSVLLSADSTSRWAEAMREMSGRLEEMPGEEGYPAYLGTRLAQFYERAGKVQCLGSDERFGTLNVVGSVSPPGGDLSEPVVQNTLRVVKVFWGLDSQLAYKRHFPAINWLTSYSLYFEDMKDYFNSEVNPLWSKQRQEAFAILQEESRLEEIVRLIGYDSLSPREQLILKIARMIREDFLHQSAFEELDMYTSLQKQFLMMGIILFMYHVSLEKIEQGVDIDTLFKPAIVEKIAKMKLITEDALGQFDVLKQDIAKTLDVQAEDFYVKSI
ncbi:V-type ATP synthase subunit A [Candidatus Margulisiibacteriota bacterium]